MRSAVLFGLMWSVWSVVATAGQAQNLIPNPSFEERTEEGGPVGWQISHPQYVSWRAEGGHEGQAFLRIEDPEERTWISVESRRLPCRPLGYYTATAWLRVRDNCAPGLYVNFYDELGNRIHHLFQRKQGPTEGWQELSVQTRAPAEVDTVSIIIYAYISDKGGFEVDDVTLTVTGGQEPGSGNIPPAPAGNKEAVALGGRRELFVDDYLIDGLSGRAQRRMHHPQRKEIVLRFDQPWEGPTSAYFAVMLVEGKIRVYYRGSGQEGEDRPECTCVAESADGVHFTRPTLGLYEWQGRKDNNIVWLGPGSHNFTPFYDTNPAAPPEERFKALASAGPEAQLVAFVSADGYRWRKLREEPVITKGAFDSQNLAFWDAERKLYVEYHRGFREGVRDIMTSTSPDFIHWTEPQWLDYGEAPPEHLYTNAITPYFRAPHIYLGFPNRFVPTRKKIPSHPEMGINDALLMSSRDMIHFQRWREAFLRPTLDPENWTDRNNYIAWGLVPLNEREIGLYATDHNRHPGACLVLYTVRVDGFASLYADATGGEMITRPFTFSGRKLEINYATSAAGHIRFALCDEQGQPYPGYALADCETIYGNELAHVVQWQGKSDVSALAGKIVRLRVNMRDADLYSLRFCD